ncbi:unnamed protein product [Staurois parvus]|uniref:Uncharacterized protein n=1 Tax=Staurois parvus TaxID=386267 RepID=A0ABN9H3X9_9NEOB|nr:unnamed protein product [Staurois parvus]
MILTLLTPAPAWARSFPPSPMVQTLTAPPTDNDGALFLPLTPMMGHDFSH